MADVKHITLPSGDTHDVKDATIRDEVKFKIYDSPTDIGLESGSATISGAYAAMELNTVLICRDSDFASSALPSGFAGTVIIWKARHRYDGWIEAKGDIASRGDWRMYIDSGEPTGTWVKMASSDFRIYDSVADLGLPAGSATIAGAFAAMAFDTILICGAGEFSDTPSNYGTVEIVKSTSTSRSFILFRGKSPEVHDYRMYLDQMTNEPTGTWVREGVFYKDFTISVSLAASTFTYVSNSSITVPTGMSIINIVLKTGSTVNLRNDAALFVTSYDNHNGFLFYNKSASAQSGTVTLRVFYAAIDSI